MTAFRNFWSCVIFTLWAVTPSEGIAVLQSIHKLNTYTGGISGAKITQPSNPVKTEDLTLCLRFNLKTLENPLETVTSPITIGREYDFDLYQNTGDDLPEWLRTVVIPAFFGFIGLGYPIRKGSFNSWLMVDIDPHGTRRDLFAANKWTHLCISFAKETGTFVAMRDGRVIAGGDPNPDLRNVTFPEDLLTLIHIGKCPHMTGTACSSPGSEYSDLNVWDRAFNIDELQGWTTCRSTEKGNLLDWEHARFQLINMTMEEVPMDNICQPVKPGSTIFPNQRKFLEIVSLCKKFHSQMAVVKSQEMDKEMGDKFAEHADACSSGETWAFFNGWWDELSEGTYTDVNTNSTLEDYQPWALSEPNGRFVENCAVTWPRRMFWNDNGCKSPRCGFCQLEVAPVFTLRGLCEKSQFDRTYSWTGNLENGYYTLNGYAKSMLYYKGKNIWIISMHRNNKTFLEVEHADYPLGLLEWTAHNDPCFENDKQLIQISLTACNSTEFDCKNGHCINMDQRCDGVIDCQDMTDELDCVVYEKPVSYLRSMPPEGGEERVVTVDLETDILAILEIAEVDSKISMQMEIHLTWYDKRLSMVNLNQEASLNYLSLESRKEIWLPEVVFYNTEIKTETLNDEKAFAVVTREGNYLTSSLEKLHNAYMYKGEDNPITLSRVYSSKIICEYDMTVYPFDSQECSAIFTMKGKFDKFVKLSAKNASYLGPIDLPQYYVIGTDIKDTKVPPGRHAVKVTVRFGRRILSVVLSSYLPTFLICVLTFCTNYFRGFYFEAIVTVNLTSMLALSTLFVGIMDSLPNTSYIKMIDVWLIFCLTIPFLHVVLHTFKEYVNGDQTSAFAMINHHGQVKMVANEGNKINKLAMEGKDRNRVMMVEPMVPSNKEIKVGKSTKPQKMRKEIVGAKMMKWGLPGYFVLFIVIYFIVGFSVSP